MDAIIFVIIICTGVLLFALPLIIAIRLVAGHSGGGDLARLAIKLGASKVPGEKAFGIITIPSGAFTGRLEDTPYRLKLIKPRKSSWMLIIELETTAILPAGLSIYPETSMDRFFKRMGVSIEVQTGDPGFDKKYYIESESSEFSRSYLSDPDKRQAIDNLIARGYSKISLCNGAPIHQEKAGIVRQKPEQAGLVSATFVRPDKSIYDRPDLIDDTVRQLHALSKDLPESGYTKSISRHAVPGRSAVENLVYPISLLLIIIAFISLYIFLLADSRKYPVLNNWDLLKVVIPLSLITIVIFLLPVIFFLKGRSSSHKEILTIGMTAAVILPLLIYSGLTVYNGKLDKSGASIHETDFVSQRIEKAGSKCRYDCIKYYLTVSSWREDRQTEEIKVRYEIYQTFKKSRDDTLLVTTYSGRFGIEWVSMAEIKTSVAQQEMQKPKKLQVTVRQPTPQDRFDIVNDTGNWYAQINAYGIKMEPHGHDLYAHINELEVGKKQDGSKINFNDVSFSIFVMMDNQKIRFGCGRNQDIHGLLNDDEQSVVFKNIIYVIPSAGQCSQGKYNCLAQLSMNLEISDPQDNSMNSKMTTEVSFPEPVKLSDTTDIPAPGIKPVMCN